MFWVMGLRMPWAWRGCGAGVCASGGGCSGGVWGWLVILVWGCGESVGGICLFLLL